MCLPQDSLLDKPVGDKIFSADMVALYGNVEPWSNVWLIAIAVATLKRLDMVDDLRVSGRLHALVADDSLRSVIDHFVNLLDLPRSELFKCVNDTNNRLVPRLRTIDTPVAIFIDSVDEYFNKHIKNRSSRDQRHGRAVAEHLVLLADGAGAGGVRAAPHQPPPEGVRVGAQGSIRQVHRRDVDGAAVSRQRDRHQLLEAEPEGDLRQQHASREGEEPVRAGTAAWRSRSRRSSDAPASRTATRASRRTCSTTSYRHTLQRPRDLMTLGQKLSDLPPEERRNEARLKVAVNQGATEIAEEYLNEISPYIGDVDLIRLFSMLRSHILSAEEVEDVRERVRRRDDGGGRHRRPRARPAVSRRPARLRRTTTW